MAQWQEGRLTIVSNSYAADQTRMHVTQMLGLPINSVRVISKYVGGQFGRGDTGDQPFFGHDLGAQQDTFVTDVNAV